MGVLALGFGEGLVGSIVTQKLLNEDGEIDWGVAIAEAGFSAVTAGFAWKEGRSVRGGGLVGSIVTQKLLNEDGEIDWGVAIAEAGFSAVTAGFAWKEGRSVRGGGSEALEGGLNSERIEYYLGKARNNIDSDTVVLGSTGKYDIIAETEGYTYFKMSDGLNSERIEYYLGKARNNIDSDTVVLGSTGKYDIIAETEGYTYFKMSDDVWTSLEKEAGGNYDEIWKVNQQFIDEQIAVNKNILLSNDPYQGYYFDDGARRFYQREIDYILSKGYTFESTSDGLWKAVRK